jgi:hypothetical protein
MKTEVNRGACPGERKKKAKKLMFSFIYNSLHSVFLAMHFCEDSNYSIDIISGSNPCVSVTERVLKLLETVSSSAQRRAVGDVRGRGVRGRDHEQGSKGIECGDGTR